MTDLIARSTGGVHGRGMTQLLDATKLPPAARHPRIFEAFDALAPGDAFVLANDHYPLPLVYQFQAERPDQFDWSVLARGPIFRVAIAKRRDPKVRRGVDEYLSWDHDRLDALLDETIDLFEASSFHEARDRWAEFACGLERHIVIEETIVFPVFDALSPAGGPTRVMRIEHEQVRRAIAAMNAALEQAATDAFDVAVEALVSVLGEHNAKEEGVLYPAIDRMLDDEARSTLVRRMQLAPP